MSDYEYRPRRFVVEMDERLYEDFTDICRILLGIEDYRLTPVQRGACIDRLIDMAKGDVVESPTVKTDYKQPIPLITNRPYLVKVFEDYIEIERMITHIHEKYYVHINGNVDYICRDETIVKGLDDERAKLLEKQGYKTVHEEGMIKIMRKCWKHTKE